MKLTINVILTIFAIIQLILAISEIDFENFKLKSIDSARLLLYTSLMITSIIGIVKYYKEKSSQSSNN